MAPRDHVQRYFWAMVPEYGAAPVGPFGRGLFSRPSDDRLQGAIGQWGMIQPKARARRPDSRPIVTNNARSETAATRATYRAAWAAAQRCLIPTAWYEEPDWATGRNL